MIFVEAFFHGVSLGIGVVAGATFAFIALFHWAKLMQGSKPKRDEFVVYQPCVHGLHPSECASCSLTNLHKFRR